MADRVSTSTPAAAARPPAPTARARPRRPGGRARPGRPRAARGCARRRWGHPGEARWESSAMRRAPAHAASSGWAVEDAPHPPLEGEQAQSFSPWSRAPLEVLAQRAGPPPRGATARGDARSPRARRSHSGSRSGPRSHAATGTSKPCLRRPATGGGRTCRRRPAQQQLAFAAARPCSLPGRASATIGHGSLSRKGTRTSSEWAMRMRSTLGSRSPGRNSSRSAPRRALTGSARPRARPSAAASGA